jgi:hypothetical protein
LITKRPETAKVKDKNVDERPLYYPSIDFTRSNFHGNKTKIAKPKPQPVI